VIRINLQTAVLAGAADFYILLNKIEIEKVTFTTVYGETSTQCLVWQATGKIDRT
jgi:hypothetical protein